MAVRFRGQETNLAETETQNMPKTGNSLCRARFMEINRREQRGLSCLKAGNLSSDPGGDVESSKNPRSRRSTSLDTPEGKSS